MLKQTFLNALFTGLAQAVSLIVIVSLAAILEAETFGILSVQLSAAALVSIMSTMQFERVYVRVRTRALAKYIAFHLRSLGLVSVVLLAVSLPFAIGPGSVILGAAIGLAQVALYAAARQGYFRRIWLLKGIQALALLIFSVLVYLSKQDSLYWLAFLGSYLCAGLVVLDRPTRAALGVFNLRNDMRRFGYSISIAAMALGSLLTGSFTREFPVLLAGAMGQPETAGTLGLVMRTVGAPIGLIARSASAVVAGYVASRRFDIAAMIRLAIIPIMGVSYIAALIIASFVIPAFDKYDQFIPFLIALTPFFVLRGYVGLLGSALVFHRLQGADLRCNSWIALVALILGGAVYQGWTDMNILLWLVSATSTILGGYLVMRLAKEIEVVR